MIFFVYLVIALVVFDLIYKERPEEFDADHALIISLGLGVFWPITLLILLGLQIHELWITRK